MSQDNNNEISDRHLPFRGDRGDPCDQNLCPGGYEQSVRALQVPGEITSHFTTLRVGDNEI